MRSDKLPADFLNTLEGMLGTKGLNRYIESLECERVYGLRTNPLKATPEQLKSLLTCLTHNVPWLPEGFYFSPENRPTKSVWYHAGLFYVQEPSAMLPAAVAGIEPGHTVLDICAAPGGKTTQAAGYLQGKGLIVANDISISRCKPLVKNIELSGVTNAIVICEKPERLAGRFVDFFDRILIDAPCSGEGMFRKDKSAISSWSRHKPEACAAIQWNILNKAAIMLKPGGRMVYSTCTFEPSENEDMIEWFLGAHNEFSIVPINCSELGISATTSGAGRIWPHLQEGEGHFVCVLSKSTNNSHRINDSSKTKEDTAVGAQKLSSRHKNLEHVSMDYFRGFCEEYLTNELDGNFVTLGESLYKIPSPMPDLGGIRTVRNGWYLGELKIKRFEPSQAFAMGLKKSDVRNTINFSSNSRDAERYLKGESFDVEAKNGWALVCVDGYPLGWAKVQNGRMKNKYLKTWIMR